MRRSICCPGCCDWCKRRYLYNPRRRLEATNDQLNDITEWREMCDRPLFPPPVCLAWDYEPEWDDYDYGDLLWDSPWVTSFDLQDSPRKGIDKLLGL